MTYFFQHTIILQRKDKVIYNDQIAHNIVGQQNTFLLNHFIINLVVFLLFDSTANVFTKKTYE